MVIRVSRVKVFKALVVKTLLRDLEPKTPLKVEGIHSRDFMIILALILIIKVNKRQGAVQVHNNNSNRIMASTHIQELKMEKSIIRSLETPKKILMSSFKKYKISLRKITTSFIQEHKISGTKKLKIIKSIKSKKVNNTMIISNSNKERSNFMISNNKIIISKRHLKNGLRKIIQAIKYFNFNYDFNWIYIDECVINY